MGYTCNNQVLANKKVNEMKENVQENQFNTFQEEKSNGIEIFNNDKNENDNNGINKLKAAPSQAGFNMGESIKDNKNNENIIFLEVKTDKITEEDFNSLIEKYPKIDDDITVEKRNPQEQKDKILQGMGFE